MMVGSLTTALTQVAGVGAQGRVLAAPERRVQAHVIWHLVVATASKS